MSVPEIQTEAGDGPGVHSVIIGINEYPFLKEGREYLKGRRAKYDFGLEQLGSPVPSALAFADWLRQEHNCGILRGSIQVLVSDPHLQLPGTRRATRANIASALEKWRNACNSHSDNVGVIFCVGHGFQMGSKEPWLLAEDYGNDKEPPFKNIIDLSFLADSMQRTQTGGLCYLIDCCRGIEHKEVVADFLESGNRENGPLRLSGPAGQPNLRRIPRTIMCSVPETEKARGPANPGALTYFTQAVLQAFRGTGAKKDAGEWVVTTDSTSLSQGISLAFQHAHGLDERRRNIEIERPTPVLEPNEYSVRPKILHRFSDAILPVIPVEIRCDPATATPLVTMKATHKKRPELFWYEGSQCGEAWNFEAAIGRYEVSAKFPGGEYRQINPQEHIFSPPIGDGDGDGSEKHFVLPVVKGGDGDGRDPDQSQC